MNNLPGIEHACVWQFFPDNIGMRAGNANELVDQMRMLVDEIPAEMSSEIVPD